MPCIPPEKAKITRHVDERTTSETLVPPDTTLLHAGIVTKKRASSGSHDGPRPLPLCVPTGGYAPFSDMYNLPAVPLLSSTTPFSSAHEHSVTISSPTCMSFFQPFSRSMLFLPPADRSQLFWHTAVSCRASRLKSDGRPVIKISLRYSHFASNLPVQTIKQSASLFFLVTVCLPCVLP